MLLAIIVTVVFKRSLNFLKVDIDFNGALSNEVRELRFQLIRIVALHPELFEVGFF